MQKQHSNNKVALCKISRQATLIVILLKAFFFSDKEQPSSGSGWKSSKEYPVNARVAKRSILGPTLFLLCINDLSVICDIAIYADDTTLYSKCDQASDLWQQLELASELESDLRDTVAC